jgi:hypothetical protein
MTNKELIALLRRALRGVEQETVDKLISDIDEYITQEATKAEFLRILLSKIAELEEIMIHRKTQVSIIARQSLEVNKVLSQIVGVKL